MDAEVPGNLPPPLPPHLAEMPAPARPWGFWATLCFGFLIAVGYIIAQTIGTLVAVSLAHGISFDDSEASGAVLAIATLFSLPVTVGLCLAFAWLRKGISVREYLGLQWPERRALERWAIYLLAFAMVSDAITAARGESIVHEFMVEVYQSAGKFVIPLLGALMIGAPFIEEFLFRGFLFAGLRQSWLGVGGAAVVTSALWAMIHLQYDLYGMATIFFAGLLLAAARVRTNSLWTPIVMHSLMNLIATVELLVYLRMLNGS